MSAIKQGSLEWIQQRRSTVGSSDIPVIVGESSYKSARTLAAEKLGLVEEQIDDETRERMDIGTLLQPALVKMYERISGRPARQSRRWFRHPTVEWATASLDGTSGRRVIECKWANAAKWRTGEKVPGDVWAQVQWQMWVTGFDVADVVALDRGLPRIETVERSDADIDNLVYFATEFHERLIRGELPPADGSESTRRTWAAMHPRDDGTWLSADAELAGLVDALRQARADEKEAHTREGTYAAVLREIIGDASGIAGLVGLKKNRDSEKVNWPAIAGAYRLLAHERGVDDVDLDAIETLNTSTSQGARPLRLLGRKDPTE